MRVGRKLFSLALAFMLISSLAVNTYSASTAILPALPPLFSQALATPPVANAGPDQAVDEESVVSLDGSGSTDPDDDVLTFAWTQVMGTEVILSNDTAEQPTFTAPVVNSNAEPILLMFNLTVTESNNSTNSHSDLVNVTVNNVNEPPVAYAGGDQDVAEGDLVQLNASASSDLDNDTLTYLWDQESGINVTLSANNVSNPTFQAPNVDSAEDLVFKLTVDDGYNTNNSDFVTVTVNDVAPPNSPPTADAGANQTANEGDPVILDGTGSSDPDNDPLTYFWIQTTGPNVTLSDNTNELPTFTAPSVNSNNDLILLSFNVTVTDPFDNIDFDLVNITVNNVNQDPVANAGFDDTVDEGNLVQLNASASSDPDNDTLSYNWSQVSGPTATLDNITIASPTFLAPSVGSSGDAVVFRVTVTDGYDGTNQDEVSIDIENVNGQPSANAGPDQPALEGDIVTLDGSGSTDPDDDVLTFAWTQVMGTEVILSNDTAEQPTFTAPDVGYSGETLRFNLTITDVSGLSNSDLVDILVGNENQPPVANAGTNQTVDEGALVTLDGTGSSDPDGDTLTYFWNQTSGTIATLSANNVSNPTFTAPSVSPAGDTLVFELTVNDGHGANATDFVSIFIENINADPVADAGSDQSINEGDTVELNGTNSSDPDNDTLTYSWSQISGIAVSITGGTTANPSFKAPNIGTTTTMLTFEVIVSDGHGGSDSDSVTITINNVAGYSNNYSPSFIGTGTALFDMPDSPSLRLQQFTAAAWFKTTSSFTPAAPIVNKGGFGNPNSEAAGQNMNYGIWLFGSQVEAGFETSNGFNRFVKTSTSYNDGNWHYAVVTYDGTTVRLYIDGTPAGSNSQVSPGPDTNGNQPLRIGANSLSIGTIDRYFVGEIDEVRVWNSAISASEVSQQRNFGIFNADGLLVYMNGVGSNSAPTANAGSDQTVNEAVTVNLDGSSSSDLDGDVLSYLWIQTGGTGVTLSNAYIANPTFTAPSVGAAGTELTFQLTVTDSFGGSHTDTVTVSVQNINLVPTANAGSDQTVNEAVTVNLNGASSTDPDGETLSYSWVQTAGPAVTISGNNTSTPSFTAPAVGSTGDDLIFELTVSDGNLGGNASDSVTISVNNVNLLPTANADLDQTANEGVLVFLNGTSSSDPDGTIASYLWTQTGGIATATLDDETIAIPSFTVPNVGSAGDTLTFELAVTDNDNGTSTDLVIVFVNNVNVPPVADAGLDQVVAEGSVVTLNGTLSNDIDGSIVTYLWAQTGGSLSASISNSSSSVATFAAPFVSGETFLTFRLNVTDNDGGTNSDSVSVTIQNYNDAPIANAGPDQVVEEGVVVQLNGTNSQDVSGSIVSYSWSQISGPLVILSGDDTALPTFAAPNVVHSGDTLSFELTVTDNYGETDTDMVDIGVQDINQPPVANAGTNQTVDEGALVTLDGTGSSDPDGDTLTYFWNQTSGTIATLSANNVSNPTFTAPSVSPAGDTLVFELTVNDDFGGNSTDTVAIVIENINIPPTADAGSDQTVNENTNVQLSGSGFDSDEGDTISYSWSQISGPSIVLVGANTTIPTFKATNVGSSGGVITFELMVVDSYGGNGTDTVTINVNNVLGYTDNNYAPSFVATGSNYAELPDSPSLRLSEFTAAAWFKTSANYAGNAMIVNKGGLGSDTSGQNMNYGIWFNSAEKLVAGFEKATNGVDITVTSAASYNDGQWHYAVVTFDGSIVRLYVDGNQIGTKSGTGPETNVIHPLRIGANANPNGNINYFIGEIDEVRVWNRTVSATEVVQQYNGVFNPDGFSIFGIGGGLIAHLHGLGFNTAPIANAGPDQTVNEAVTVNLDGSSSSDLDGDLLSYLWTQTSGPAVALSRAYIPTSIFVAPSVLSGGATLTFKLTVNDGYGDTDVDSVTISVQNTNQPPSANAGQDKNVDELALVILNGTASSDPDGDPLSYLWNQTSGPAVTLSAPNIASPTFTSPSVGPNGTLLTIALTVSDGLGLNNTGSVTITVLNTVTPQADLDTNATTLFGGEVASLDASNSQGNAITSYVFEQIAGTPGNITANGSDPAKAIFVSPANVTEDEEATLKVTVTDSFGETNSTTEVILLKKGNKKPIANAGSDQNVNEKSIVNLSGTGSSDPDNYPEPLSYLWQQIDTTGFTISLSNPASATPSFTAPAISTSNTTLTFMLTVDDGRNSATDTVNIVVNNIPTTGYSHAPSFIANGTTFYDIPDHSDLRLQQFTVAAWIKNSFNYIGDTVMVNKGGFDLEAAGFNQNYGIWMDKNEKIKGGFEAADSANYVAISPNSYSDGNWHYVVVTFDGTDVKLYIDSNQVATASAVGVLPDTGGTQPLRIGANSQNTNKFFKGEIDEVRVWNRAVSSTEVSQQRNPGIFDASGLLVYMDGVDHNSTPKSNAGPDKVAVELTTVSLVGAASSDADADVLTYWWSQTGGPSVSLNNANSATATFAAPNVSDAGATLTFALKVGDGHGATSTDSVVVSVKDGNVPPIASAGSDQTLDEGTVDIILNGTASSDPDGDILEFSWVQTAGQTVSLDDPTAMNPAFSVPLVSADTMLTFEVTVSDGISADSDTVNIFVTNIAGGYAYSPAFIATGSNKYDIPHHASLQLTKFSIAAWFKTSATHTTNAMIVNKGGFGSDSAGQNMNYAIWMNTAGRIQAGFETSSGADLFVLSSGTYNDGNLHYAVLTYDGSKLKLYIDGIQVATRNTSAIPETAFQRPVRLGANSQADTYTSSIKPLRFIGDIDEVRIWNKAISSVDVVDQYLSGIFSENGLRVHMNGVSHESLPISNAGSDQSVNEGILVNLDGGSSNDPDGTTLSYLWEQTDGPTVTLSSATVANPSFTAPIVAFNRVLVFQLTVSDGLADATDIVEVTVINTAGGYTYLPSGTFEGDNYIDIPDSAALDLTTFSVSAWIETSATPSTDAVIVNKGGIGLDGAGQELNYGIWMDSAGKIRAGYEQSTGTNRFVVSPASYNDGDLHYVVLTYNGAILLLYVDGTQVEDLNTTNLPDTGTTTPLRVGANALDLTRYFDGKIDEVRIWNRAVTAAEVAQQYDSGNFNPSGQVAHITMADAPIPSAGSIQIVKENELTNMNGGNTTDPNSDPLTYAWTQVSGPAVSLNNANTATPSFTAPGSILGEEPLKFELRVGDGQYISSDTVIIYAVDAQITHAILSSPDYMIDVADAIRNATQSVDVAMFYVETYSSNEALNELQAAKNRGVQVRLIFAPQTLDVYPSAENGMIARGIPYKIVPNHAKIVVIDDKIVYLGSANWNKNGLENNWELTLRTNNTDTVEEASQYFDGLWNTGSPTVDTDPLYYERMVTGLEFYNMLLDQMASAQSIKVLMFEMTYNFNDPQAVDSKVLNEIKNAHDRGIELQLVLDDPRYFETYGGQQFLTQQSIPHKLDDKNTGILQRMHAKAVLIDNSLLFLGSQNWNDDSLDSSIEASLITRDPQTIADYQAIFDEKWTTGYFPE